jgi:hypothetical protein
LPSQRVVKGPTGGEVVFLVLVAPGAVNEGVGLNNVAPAGLVVAVGLRRDVDALVEPGLG